jgi:AFG3 family protein
MGGMMGGGGNNPLGMGKTHVQIYGVDKKIGTKFKDVAGLDEAKVEIMEFVDFLKKPEKFTKIGAKIPRGALLSGPPGTGKTMLAKAAAGEAGVPFLYISGSDFVEMFVGVGASRVRDLFTQAKKHAPSIIFIDEIDAVGKKRDSRMGNDEKDNTLNQLLVEMDGFSTDQNVVILGATNRKELLDPALTRPGRFDRSIEVTLPDLEGRKQIFLVHLKPIKLDPSKTPEEYAKRLATLTPGFSGADIANLCNEAAILSARKGKDNVSTDEFESASERVLAGLEKKRIISEEERKVVSVHESGHAVVSWFLEGGFPLLKLTIIPRSKGSLGFAQYLPNESSLQTKEELMDRICCILGGRCSEEFFNGKVTTGAYDDLKKAYDIARSMVMQFGMSDKIGFIGYSEDEYVKKHSEDTAKEIDREIKRIIDECTEKTRALIRERAKEIKALSDRLLEKETLDLQAIIGVLGQRPFAPKSNFKAYLEYKTKGEETVEKKPEENQKKDGEDENQDGGNKESIGKTPKLKPKTA